MSELRQIFPENPSEHIKINDSDNSITFKIQEGPIQENGVNGCQIDDVIDKSKQIVEYFNAKFPCRENSLVITKLDEALLWLNARKDDRISRKVEGFNKK